MMKYEMPVYFEVSVSVRAMRMPNLATMRERRPDLLAVHDEHVAVAHGAGGQVGQVGAGLGLAEELAPHLLAAEHRRQVALLLLLRPVDDDHRSAVPDADRVERLRDTGALELVVDDELELGLGVEPPRLGPVRGDVARVDELGRGRVPGARPASAAPRAAEGRRREAGRCPRR